MLRKFGAVALFILIFPAFVQTQPRVQDPWLKTEIEKRAVQFFIDAAHPVSGLVLDKTSSFGPLDPTNRIASIASTGFGLTVIASAAERGLIEKSFAKEYLIRTMKFTKEHVSVRKGWFVHFIDWETGKQIGDSEYSTIDTALFLGGALYAATVFPGTEVERLAYEIYQNVDVWDALTDGGTLPNKRSITMAYSDKNGYTDGQWAMYAEQMLLLILAMGHPTQAAPPETWLSFERDLATLPNGEKVMGLEEALFVHQYSQLFIDFRGLEDGFKNYHHNTELISRHHREIAFSDTHFRTLREGFWGFSAGESPVGYEVWNALRYQGTVCIGCTIASAPFMPSEVMSDLNLWYNSAYQAQIWGKYGFVDSVDLDQNWTSPMVLGITVGPAYMAMANLSEETSIWRKFMQIPAVKLAMSKAAIARRTFTKETSLGFSVAE